MPAGCCRRRRSSTTCGTTTSTARPTSSSPTSPTCGARSTPPSRGSCTRSAGWATPCGCRVARDHVSAGAADDVAAPRTRMSRVPLRITLVALLVVLVALALVATGAGATAMLRGYLVAQQDDELRTVLQQAEGNRGLIAACLAEDEQWIPSS